MFTPIDHAERQAALNPEKSFIVQAPAGSGKTELLTRRYLALLACVKDPEEILAITFTRKAATEMRSRILAALDSSHPLLENPNRLRVQTIDSLCASITRQMPILSGMGGQTDVTDDPQTLYQQAARQVLLSLEEDLAWQPALMQLLFHLDNDHVRVENLFCAMLSRRDQWLAHVAQMGLSDQRHVLEQGLQNAICEHLIRTKENLPAHLVSELLALFGFAKKEHFAQLPDTNPDDISQWLSIAEFLLTKEGEWRKEANKNVGIPAPSTTKDKEEKALLTEMKNRYKELLTELNQHETFKQDLQDLRNLPPANYNDNQWQIIMALLELLPILVAQLHVIFQEHGVVDYIEVASRALQALGKLDSPTDLALQLDYQIQHILVDEFQDTSVSQWRLLEHLTAGWQLNDGRTLFLVGDPMQSIYRFRKAEVGLFLRARHNGIGSIKLEPLTLQVNFRSTPGIVTWINKTFKSLLPEQEDIGTGAVTYCPSEAMSSQEIIPAKSGIQLNLFSVTDLNYEPQKVVQIIQEIQKTDPLNHIGILVRARSHLLEILSALQQAVIPYRAVEIETLSERPVVQDLLALTRALLHLADRIAWLAVLRAPWCGLTLGDLHVLVGDKPHKIIWDRLALFNELSLSVDGKQRLQRVVPILAQNLQQRRRQTLARWVEKTWVMLGGPACLLAETEYEDARAFFKLLEKLEVAGDLPDLTLLEKQVVNLYSNTTTIASVEVMTIHKAKGLEFDTVILPGLHRTLASDDPQLLLAVERPTQSGDADLLLAPIKSAMEEQDLIYDYLRNEEKKRADYEATRLLYVATTRAKRALYLLAGIDLERKTISTKNSLLAKLWPVIGQDFLQTLEINEEQVLQNNNINDMSREKPLRRLVSNWQSPIDTMVEKKVSTENPLSDTISAVFDPERHIGTVVHRLLQQIFLDGVEQWNEKIIEARRPFICNLLTHEGVIQDQLAISLAITERALKQTLQDPRGLWILSQQHQESHAEYPLTANNNGKLLQVIIDRTFIDESGVRWIVDYKTTDYQGESLEEFLAQQKILHSKQLEQYAQILRLSATNPIMLGLYFPLLSAWLEWKY